MNESEQIRSQIRQFHWYGITIMLKTVQKALFCTWLSLVLKDNFYDKAALRSTFWAFTPYKIRA